MRRFARRPRWRCPRLHADPEPLPRGDEEAARHGADRARVGELQLDRGQYPREHDLHLVEGERHSEAAAHSAPEGRPLVGVGPLAEEALGAELVRLGVEVGPPVHHAESVRDRGSLGDLPVAQTPRRLDDARPAEGHDRTEAQDLLDHRVEVLELRERLAASRHLAGAGHLRHLVADAAYHRGPLQQALESPGERRAGRLVPGQHQRRELVPHLGVRQPFPLLVARQRAASRGCPCARRRRPRRGASGSRPAAGGRSPGPRVRRGPTGSTARGPTAAAAPSAAARRAPRSRGAPAGGSPARLAAPARPARRSCAG